MRPRLSCARSNAERDSSWAEAIGANVPIYLNNAELALTLAKMAVMLAAGGCFPHNQPTTAVETYGGEAGLAVCKRGP